eukprot:snap_masked-scaffold_30-processed-gene-2.61-mRNA-1 protein AED:1.00 eAED:1.00 QI:0/-1/0/0/-1/1/1/0/294
MKNNQYIYSYKPQDPHRLPPFHNNGSHNPLFNAGLDQELNNFWVEEPQQNAEDLSVSTIGGHAATQYAVSVHSDKKDEQKKRTSVLCSFKIKFVLFCCCCVILLAGIIALVFPRDPDFTPDLNNLNIDGVDLSEGGFLKMSFPLNFQNVNFLPLTILELKAQVDFEDFIIDLNIDDKIEMGIRGEGNGTALLFLDFSNTFGALGPILGQCTVGLIGDIDPLIGTLSGEALAKYLGIEASAPIDPSKFELGCPLVNEEEKRSLLSWVNEEHLNSSLVSIGAQKYFGELMEMKKTL